MAVISCGRDAADKSASSTVPLIDTISRNLLTIRRNNGLTQKDLARILRCPLYVLRNAEHGKCVTDTKLVDWNLVLRTNLRFPDAGQTVTVVRHDDCGHHCFTIGKDSRCFVCEMLERKAAAGWVRA